MNVRLIHVGRGNLGVTSQVSSRLAAALEFKRAVWGSDTLRPRLSPRGASPLGRPPTINGGAGGRRSGAAAAGSVRWAAALESQRAVGDSDTQRPRLSPRGASPLVRPRTINAGAVRRWSGAAAAVVKRWIIKMMTSGGVVVDVAVVVDLGVVLDFRVLADAVAAPAAAPHGRGRRRPEGAPKEARAALFVRRTQSPIVAARCQTSPKALQYRLHVGCNVDPSTTLFFFFFFFTLRAEDPKFAPFVLGAKSAALRRRHSTLLVDVLLSDNSLEDAGIRQAIGALVAEGLPGGLQPRARRVRRLRGVVCVRGNARRLSRRLAAVGGPLVNRRDKSRVWRGRDLRRRIKK